MLQRTEDGLPILDIAKTFAESLVSRLVERSAREAANSIGAILPRVDRCFLLTTDGRVRAGWSDSFAAFRRELRSIRATSIADVPTALKAAYSLLSEPQMQRANNDPSINAGGRCPFSAEPSFVVLITDGCSNYPPVSPVPDEEFPLPTMWDQRLFIVKLAFPSETPYNSRLPEITIAEFAEDGRVFVLSDPKDVQSFLQYPGRPPALP